MTIRVLDPTQPPQVLPATLARRSPITAQISLALLSNAKTNASELMRLVKDELSKQLNIDRVVEAAKESASTNAPETMLDQLAEECDLALVAIGD